MDQGSREKIFNKYGGGGGTKNQKAENKKQKQD
jgi:hypothetical protein